jgi:hypothetical protein
MFEDAEFGELTRIVEKYLTTDDTKRIMSLPKIRNLVGHVSRQAAARVIMREMIDVARATGRVTGEDDRTIDRLMATFGLEDPYSGKPLKSSSEHRERRWWRFWR